LSFGIFPSSFNHHAVTHAGRRSIARRLAWEWGHSGDIPDAGLPRPHGASSIIARMAVLYVALNLAIDILYRIIDPRVRLEG
jgi:hypothetical protein